MRLFLYFTPFGFGAAAFCCLFLPSSFLCCYIVALPLFFLAFDNFPIFRRAAPFNEPSFYRLVPLVYVPLQLVLIAFGVLHAETGHPFRFVALTLAIGLTTGIFGVLAAHELIHSRERMERVLGQIFYAAIAYPHFGIAHVKGHHRLAATEEDPATARRGENFYRFILRSAAGQAQFALRIERLRAVRKGKLLPGNLAAYGTTTLLVYAASGALIGLRSMLFLIAQSLVAIFVLELFNYIAHYGLRRDNREDGRVMPMSAAFSWNTGRAFSNIALLNGGHHSDHHRKPAGQYQNLSAIDGAPELRFGYGGTMLLALVPPLWRAIMHPRLDDLEKPRLARVRATG